jgi:hypothetical protein
MRDIELNHGGLIPRLSISVNERRRGREGRHTSLDANAASVPVGGFRLFEGHFDIFPSLHRRTNNRLIEPHV